MHFRLSPCSAAASMRSPRKGSVFRARHSSKTWRLLARVTETTSLPPNHSARDKRVRQATPDWNTWLPQIRPHVTQDAGVTLKANVDSPHRTAASLYVAFAGRSIIKMPDL